MSKAMIDAQINTITEMLEEFNIKADKCDNKNILSFAKTIGENISYTSELIRRSSLLDILQKIELGQEIERLENEFGNTNDNFSNKCKCNK